MSALRCPPFHGTPSSTILPMPMLNAPSPFRPPTGSFGLFVAGLLLLAVGVAACDSGSPSEDAPEASASYEFSVAGGETTFSGEALWSTGSTDEASEATAITFANDDGSDRGLMIRGAERPEPGTYSVQNIDQPGGNLTSSPALAFYFVDGQSDTSVQYLSKTGTITVTESTDEWIRGRLDVQVKRVDPLSSAGETTTPLTGTFDAQYATSVGVFAP